MDEDPLKELLRTTVVILFVCAEFAASATFATPGTPARAATTHGAELAGAVMAVNTSSKSFVLKTRTKVETIFWTEGTTVAGGKLERDETATVRWIEKHGRKIATSVKITGRVSSLTKK